MKRFLLAAALVATISCSVATEARAQSQTMFGPDIGLWVGGGLGDVGFLLDFLVTPEVAIQPALHVVFGRRNETIIVFDGNVHYNFPIRGETFSPYVRGGIGIWDRIYSFDNVSSSEVDLHINIGGGITLQTRSNLQPFFGMSVYLVGGSDVKLHGGVKFAM